AWVVPGGRLRWNRTYYDPVPSGHSTRVGRSGGYNPAVSGTAGPRKGEDAMERLRPGDKIYSSQFGRGEVVAVEGFGDGETVEVRFEGGELRTLRPEQHRLELIEAEVPARIPLQRELNSPKRDEPEGDEEMIHEEIRAAVRDALQDLLGLGESELSGRWA